jgi:hypothetical protein
VNILTKYENNNGSTENCLNSSSETLDHRIVDYVDIATDECAAHHYKVKIGMMRILNLFPGLVFFRRVRTYPSSAAQGPSEVLWRKAGETQHSPSCAHTSWLT